MEGREWTMKEKKPKKLSYYRKKAWKQFSIYVRTRDSDNNGYCKCCTCEAIDEIRYFQAGHFVAGRNNSILFREDNCHAQDVGCNMFGGGRPAIYYQFMLKNYGIEVINELQALSWREVIYKQHDYEEIEAKYKQKIKELGK